MSADAAIKTLTRLGYTYRGGEEWMPPIGPKPDWSFIEDLTKRISFLETERVSIRKIGMAFSYATKNSISQVLNEYVISFNFDSFAEANLANESLKGIVGMAFNTPD